jgi:hypothetical protein
MATSKTHHHHAHSDRSELAHVSTQTISSLNLSTYKHLPKMTGMKD